MDVRSSRFSGGFREPRLRFRLAFYLGSAVAIVALVLPTSGFSRLPERELAAPSSEELEALAARVLEKQALLIEVQRFYEEQVAPVERVMLRQREDTALARRIALAIRRESAATGLSPWLLTGVLLVENPWLAPDTASFVGALGLMQVMPIHAGNFGCGSRDLSDVDVNICHGARILAMYYRREGGNLNRALLRYNGCVRGTNTPDCHLYPSKVRRRARRAQIYGGGTAAGRLAAL